MLDLMKSLLSSRQVSQVTQVQPAMGTVGKAWGKASFVSPISGLSNGSQVSTNRDVLTVGVWGATTPNAFITVSGIPPKSRAVKAVGSIAGSDVVQGGVY